MLAEGLRLFLVSGPCMRFKLGLVSHSIWMRMQINNFSRKDLFSALLFDHLNLVTWHKEINKLLAVIVMYIRKCFCKTCELIATCPYSSGTCHPVLLLMAKVWQTEKICFFYFSRFLSLFVNSMHIHCKNTKGKALIYNIKWFI